MLCPIKVNSNTIELTVHTSCNCILDLLCVTSAVLPVNIQSPNSRFCDYDLKNIRLELLSKKLHNFIVNIKFLFSDVFFGA